jgi:hypothetical protein
MFIIVEFEQLKVYAITILQYIQKYAIHIARRPWISFTYGHCLGMRMAPRRKRRFP